MTEPTSNNTFTVQCAKAARCSVTALLEKIKTAEFTTEAVKELSHLLCSIDKALERVASLFDQPQSCMVKLGDQHHLRMAIWSNQGACERYQDNFTKWTSHSNDDFLRDSDWNFFDIFKDIESRLLSEKLRLFKDTIDKAVQTSALLTTFSASENISDDEWDSILVKESSLLSAVIEANKCHHAHQLIERAAERVICEIKGHGIAMQHHRNFLMDFWSSFASYDGGKELIHGTKISFSQMLNGIVIARSQSISDDFDLDPLLWFISNSFQR
ncbi:hypothetical protein N7490_006677 [Penicillium lividum]|nr:hypothetical protein N7490_006677 [Penicillium lividum]